MKDSGWDSAYQHDERDISIPISEDGKCVVAKDLHSDDKIDACT